MLCTSYCNKQLVRLAPYARPNLAGPPPAIPHTSSPLLTTGSIDNSAAPVFKEEETELVWLLLKCLKARLTLS